MNWLSKLKLTFDVFLQNIKLKKPVSLTPRESQLVRDTHLFTKMNQRKFYKMLLSAKRVKYSKEKLIFREGEQGDSIFIILNGAVRVFTYDVNGIKIPIARLNKGGYFGEQALLGRAYKTRKANIEAIIDTTLLKIDAKFINKLLRSDVELKTKLKKIGYQEFLEALSLSTGLYKDLQSTISHIENPNIKEFSPGKLIFKEGDKSDCVYIILEGVVKLLFSKVDSDKMASLLLHRGQIFGELGVLKNKPRSATAIADSNLKLLSISSEDFQQYVEQNPELRKTLTKLEQIYLLPLHGQVEQHVGKVEEFGSSIVNIYKMDDGRYIIASKLVDQDIFIMNLINTNIEEHYKFEKGDDSIELDVNNHRIVGIKVHGFWGDLSKISRAILNDEFIENETLHHFEESGEFTSKADEKSIESTCQCHSISREELLQLVDEGTTDFEAFTKRLDISEVCERCKHKILEILGKSFWLSASMKKFAIHNPYTRSYLIRPFHVHFNPPLPGQHIIIQVKIGDNWIERPYSVSGLIDNQIRITIKKEPKGLFGQWLFENIVDETHINVTQPHGTFLMDMAEDNPALCFAGGVGIVPFIMYAQSLSNRNNKKRLHIVYCAANENEFILKDEFNQITQLSPSVTITYWPSDTKGFLTKEEVIKVVTSFYEPDVYICGPEGYQKLICQYLHEIGFNSDKIHTEKFVHAGEAPKGKG